MVNGEDGQVFSLEIREDGIAVVRIDVPGERQNTLKAEFIPQVDALLDRLEAHEGLRGVVFTSGKPGSFIAGADIGMIRDCADAAEASALSRAAQALFARIATLPVPVVAAIDGACLGGGLELALACHARVCSDAGHTVLGLPEVKLGVLPGGGGTQRLPRLIGIAPALELMLAGRQLRPAQARRRGLVDEVVPAAILLQAAVERIGKGGSGQAGRRAPSLLSAAGLRHRLLEANPLGRRLLFSQARARVRARSGGHYPAPGRIIDCVETGMGSGMTAGLEAEARAFGALALSPEARQLMYLYFATTAMKKDSGLDKPGVEPAPVRRVGVLGAGLMGAGISYVTADKAGLPVRLKDTQAEGLTRGLRHIDGLVQKRRRRGALSPFQAGLTARRITPTLDYSGFARADVVIEAVFEDLELKQRMLQEVEARCPGRTVFATNTSSIPIARIASAASRPGQVIGMHYFSPVEKMPLLEVIAAADTALKTIATAVALGRRQGKTVIVVKDGPGFYVNRILAPYMNEAGRLLDEGVAIDAIDAALTGFGFPVGPLALLDEVGIDVASKVGPILHEAFGERMAPSTAAEALMAEGRLGRKSGRGFYLYPPGGKKRVDATVYGLLEVHPNGAVDAEAIARRCVLLMVNEAARCLDEGVVRSARDADIGAVFGIGFPPFRGGPLRYADSVGAAALVEDLEDHRQRLGERFEPASVLVKMAREGRRFHDD